VINDYLTASLDGVTVLRQTVTTYPIGRLILGIYQPRPRSGPEPSAPPERFYSVRFDDIHIWSPAHAGTSPSPSSPSSTP
jgi:hypothetical protein